MKAVVLKKLEAEAESQKEKDYLEYCMAESNEAYTQMCKNQEEYDKQLLTLSTGMLAVLLAFVKDLVHMDTAIQRWLFFSSLSSLVATIAIVLASFQISNLALKRIRSYWKEQYGGRRELQFPENVGLPVEIVNYGGGVLFFIGLLQALLFIILNLVHQAHK